MTYLDTSVLLMLAEDFAFAAADTRLLEAARAERFRALNVERIHAP